MQNTLIALLISILSFLRVTAQDSPDSAQVQKEVQRVNNPTPVEKMIIPTLKPKDVTVTPVVQAMSKGDQPGIMLDIPEVTVDDIQRDLEKSIKSKTKSKFVKVGNETSIQETIIKEISENPLNVFVLTTPLDSGARIITFMAEGETFIDEASGSKYDKMKTFVRDFGISAYREAVANQIRSEEKVLKDLEGDLDKLKKENEKLHADIKDNETTILNSEVDIKANARQQEAKDEEIIQQKKLVSSIKDKDLRKEENKKVNSLEKEKDDLRDALGSLNRKIIKSRANIEELEDKVKVNLQEQDLMKKKVVDQRALLKGLEAKLDSIK
jgi:hypothetical protein